MCLFFFSSSSSSSSSSSFWWGVGTRGGGEGSRFALDEGQGQEHEHMLAIHKAIVVPMLNALT